MPVPAVLRKTLFTIRRHAVGQQAPSAINDFTSVYAGNFFCAPTASGGILFDEQRDAWRGAAFQVEGPGFVIRVSATETREVATVYGQHQATIYGVILKRDGKLARA
jgi:hypothetical protein